MSFMTLRIAKNIVEGLIQKILQEMEGIMADATKETKRYVQFENLKVRNGQTRDFLSSNDLVRKVGCAKKAFILPQSE